MSTENGHRDFYRQALLYEIAFSYRPVVAECDFMLECFERVCGVKAATVVELCSGPGYHAIEFARRGLKVAVLDLSAEMVERCLDSARAHGVEVSGVIGDARNYTVEQRVDMIVNLLTSISYLVDAADIVSHFRCTFDALNPGGLYIVESNHPNDFISGSHFSPSRWTMQRDSLEVTTTWCAGDCNVDWVKQTYSALATEADPILSTRSVPPDVTGCRGAIVGA